MIGFLMQKIVMTAQLNKDGKILPVSILKTKDVICLKKTQNLTNKIFKVTIGFFSIETKDKKKFNSSFLNGNYQLDDDKRRFIKEFKVNKIQFDKLIEGQNINLTDFLTEDQIITVTGIVKGRGFTGGMRRHGFSGQPASHGISVSHRSIGSTGSRKPRRVMKGRKMPGHYGNHQVTISGIKIIKIIDQNTITIKGSVPGSNGSLVIINK